MSNLEVNLLIDELIGEAINLMINSGGRWVEDETQRVVWSLRLFSSKNILKLYPHHSFQPILIVPRLLPFPFTFIWRF